jgi:hypothetical protein
MLVDIAPHFAYGADELSGDEAVKSRCDCGLLAC